MIPKIIHYCWFSDDPYPEKIKKCMDSWKKYLPDYEFVHWDREKLYALNSMWAIDAFENKKYAFAADYVRCYAVYEYGGIYLDSDVEVLQSFDKFLTHRSFIGLDSVGDLEAAVFGAESHVEWLKDAVDFYNGRPFVKEDGTFNIITMPNVFRKVLNEALIPDLSRIKSPITIGDITIYPSEYFSPKDYTTGLIKKNKKTVSIHHFEGSWLQDKSLSWQIHVFKTKLAKILGQRIITKMSKIYHSMK